MRRCAARRASAVHSRCTERAPEPSRRISSSVSRGNITGNRARSADGGHRQDTVLPVVLVCTITHPLERTSSGPSAAHQPRRKPVISRLRIAQPLHLCRQPGVGLLRPGRRIADIGRAVAPHRVHHHCQLACDRDAGLGMALSLRELQPPALDLVDTARDGLQCFASELSA